MTAKTKTPAAQQDITSTKQSVAAAPIAAGQRISSLDFIRGVAVMGILGANIILFGQPLLATMSPDGFVSDAADPLGLWWLGQFVLIDGKMRALFTILFGAGVYLFMERAWQRGEGLGLQAQRLAWLAVFGLIHFFGIWVGDILFHYAICGLCCLFLVKQSIKTQISIGLVGYVLGSLMYMFSAMDVSGNPDLLKAQSDLESKMMAGFNSDATSVAMIKSGDYAGFVTANIQDNWSVPFLNVPSFFLETASLILIGMALYRMGFFNGGFDRSAMVRWGWIGVIAGGLVSALIGLWTINQDLNVWAVTWATIGLSMPVRFVMALGLAALLVVYSPAWTGWLAERIRAAGRAAFTNYLGTSIVMLVVFHGWGLGLFGKLSRPELYGVTFAAWCLMLLWSKPWLDRFYYGPLEWLWRCLTYRKIFALKR